MKQITLVIIFVLVLLLILIYETAPTIAYLKYIFS